MKQKTNSLQKKVLIVFGSASDEKVFMPIARKLKEKKVVFDVRICSAHRTPDLLNAVMNKRNYDLIIAGAGLAAHLPGVVASNTVVPIIGVPVSSNFEGLDALLSIAQMPPGIPVLAVGPDKNPVSDFILGDYESVKIIGDMKNPRVKKCVETLEEFDIEVSEGSNLVINFFDLKKGKPRKDAINVPLADKETAKDSLLFLEKSGEGYFVGLNRGDNAAIFAVSMIDRFPLIDYREKMRQKIIDDDKKISQETS